MKKYLVLALLTLVALLAAACQAPPVAVAPADAPDGASTEQTPFVIGAIPDQDPEKLQRQFGLLSDYLSAELGVPVEYKPVTDYTAAVSAFRSGDLDMVWFGGLTGVQARLQVPGAQALVQRDIDETFHSVFIANADSGLQPIDDISGLAELKGHTFTFGSDSSTSGRLMPQYFLSQAGVTLDDFTGEAGFSGSHDKTIQLVEAGTYEAGALNEQVWESRVASNEVDLSKVVVLWRTPSYHDYHWVLNPEATTRFGADFPARVTDAFLALDPANADDAQILDLFGAQKFIATNNDNYAQIEAVGREIGKIVN
ncbi:MAG: putative selenate ABC transporter substrate-binding protein [Caldilineales bacterium]